LIKAVANMIEDRMQSHRRAAPRFAMAVLMLLASSACDDGKKSRSPTPDSGTPSTSCSAADPCGPGLVCLAGACTAGEARGLSFSADVRGCELVLADSASAQVASVSFGAGTKGSLVRRAPRTGVSVIADGDHPIEDGAANVVIAGDGDPAIGSFSCVDKNGTALPKASVSLQD